MLFLDELPEFDRRVLEVLREPLESGHIIISRAARQAEFPAAFQLMAAMNPCPCGYQGDESGRCHCTPERIDRYRGRLSGPLLDRIDMHLSVAPISTATLMAPADRGESSKTVRQRVAAARARAEARTGDANAALSSAQIDQCCDVHPQARQLLERAIARLNLSARGYHRILRVARTIADLAGHEQIQATAIAEAVGYRQLDRGSGP